MIGDKVLVSVIYGTNRTDLKEATVIATGTYKNGRKYIDVICEGVIGKWRERFFKEDVR